MNHNRRSIHRAATMAMLTVLFSAVTIAAAPPAVPVETRITVGVDPRVELLSTIFRLAGNPEYNQPTSRSSYADAVDARFGPHRDHPVVRTARALRRDHGVSYDAVMSMAVHITDTASIGERIPFDEKPARLDERWPLQEARRFLDELRAFVRATGFNDFVRDHDAYYAAAAQRLQRHVDDHDFIGWFDQFFGRRPGASFHAIPGLLNGGGNYGIGIRFPDGREAITPVIGAYRFDNEALPVFGDEITATIVHELCHSYTNPFVDAFADQLEPAGQRLFPRVEDTMRRQAYGSWKTMMYESLVRACTVRYAATNQGGAAARDEIRHHQDRGFRWIDELAVLLAEFESNRAEYPTFDLFMPRIVTFFNEYATTMDEMAARAPRIVSMDPANGALDVDPSVTSITVTFDRAMKNNAWSVVGGGPDFPAVAGAPSYDERLVVFRLPVRLKPGWTYRYSLNSERFVGFRSADDVPLEPVAVTFTTRAE